MYCQITIFCRVAPLGRSCISHFAVIYKNVGVFCDTLTIYINYTIFQRPILKMNKTIFFKAFVFCFFTFLRLHLVTTTTHILSQFTVMLLQRLVWLQSYSSTCKNEEFCSSSVALSLSSSKYLISKNTQSVSIVVKLLLSLTSLNQYIVVG